MGAYLHSHKLLALAVFAESFKMACVRSIHVHEDGTGSARALQQDFLFSPGKYKLVTATPLMFGSCFHTLLLGLDTKEDMDNMIRMQQNEGWHCMLDYRSDAHSNTSMMPSALAPSKNLNLKDLPSLEQDLKVVESSILSHNANDDPMNGRRPIKCQTSTTGKEHNLAWCPPSLMAPSCPLVPSFSDHSSDRIPGLETPERTPNGQAFDIWHNWGSELELASPNASFTRASLSDQGHNDRSPWSTTMMLDLNLDLAEFPAQNANPDCTLLLSTPGSDPKPPLVCLELGKPSLSLQHSSIADNNSTDFSASEFSDVSLSSEHVKLNTLQSEKSLCREDSVSCQGSAINGSGINASSSDANGNSAATASSGAYSAYDKNMCLSMNKELYGSPSITFSDMCSTAFYENAKDDGQTGNHNSTKACSSAQSVRQWVHNVDALKNKRRSARPRSTSEGITDITFNELSQYFSMPITQAAKQLNVGLTVLKKRCREFQIPRWPHRKMKSINSLISNIKDLADDQGVKSSNRVLNAVRELEEQRRLMKEMPGVELAERTKKLRQACFKANYKKRRLGMISIKSADDNALYHASAPTAGPPLLSGSSSPLTCSMMGPLGIVGFNPNHHAISTTLSCLTKDHFL